MEMVKRKAHGVRVIDLAMALAIGSAPVFAQAPASWLDRPLANWNGPRKALPKPPAGDARAADFVARCRLAQLRSTSAQRAVASGGWVPFRYFGKDLSRGDVDIIGGMAGADGMCRPLKFNVFVFVGGRFAGTLSPIVMNSRIDSGSGAASFAESGIDVLFDRYAPSDPLCCPSARVMVRYRIDRTSRGPVVVPVSVAPAPP
jgi:LppP/LprE lipoprotein